MLGRAQAQVIATFLSATAQAVYGTVGSARATALLTLISGGRVRARFEECFTSWRMAHDYLGPYEGLLQQETRRGLKAVRMLDGHGVATAAAESPWAVADT
jgi:hypothetical protein